MRVSAASGARIINDLGRTLLDFNMGWGSCLLGHDPPALRRALSETLEGGFLHQYESPLHSVLAEEFCRLVPCADQIRFANTGLEATMFAVRMARAITGKRLIVKFEGHFHGLGDQLAWSTDSSDRPGEIGEDGVLEGRPATAGLPAGIELLIIVLPWNEIESLESAFARFGDDIAAVILEPVALNMGCIPPEPGFLESLRDLTRRAGSLLIFDEMLTGFRLALGGAQEVLGVMPDLACYGKAFGCGMPIAAVAGERTLMQVLSPVGSVEMSGTNTGRQLTVAGTLAALRAMQAPGFYSQIEQLTDMLVDGLVTVFDDHGVPAHVAGRGGCVGVHVGSKDRPTNYRQVTALYNRPFVGELFVLLSQRFDLHGFLLPYGQSPGLLSISAAHQKDDIDSTLERLDEALTLLPYREA